MDVPSSLLRPLARYAARLHAATAGTHHVSSPLGAWLVLALVADAAPGPQRAPLEEVLGCDAPTARALAHELLTSAHPDVVAAAAAWVAVDTPALTAWLRDVAEVAETGPVPPQATADRWAREHTLGLVPRFPLDVETDPPAVVLATALATRVTWRVPFEVVPATELGDGPLATGVGTVLRGPGSGPGQRCWIAATGTLPGLEDVGDVVVHEGQGGRGLRVLSVVADADVPAARVMDTALRLANDPAAPRRSLFDLPLGDAPRWSVEEQHRRGSGSPRQEVVQDVTLPAWSARSDHDLLDLPGLGFDLATRVVGGLFGRPDERAEARQVAVARYHREGFEAAAVTAMMVGRAMAVEPHEVVVRTARLRFPHPYAVVAVAGDDPTAPPGDAPAVPEGWRGIPVFSAWVAGADEAGTDD